MRTYQVLGLLVIVSGVTFIAGLRVGESRATRRQLAPGGCDACAGQPGRVIGSSTPAPAIPTGSGLSCLVELGANDCDECQRMTQVIGEVTTKLTGKVDVVSVDTNVHPQEAQRWRLRMIPTQLLVDAQGKEIWRHEGFVAADELLAKVAPVTGGRK